MIPLPKTLRYLIALLLRSCSRHVVLYFVAMINKWIQILLLSTKGSYFFILLIYANAVSCIIIALKAKSARSKDCEGFHDMLKQNCLDEKLPAACTIDQCHSNQKQKTAQLEVGYKTMYPCNIHRGVLSPAIVRRFSTINMFWSNYGFER